MRGTITLLMSNKEISAAALKLPPKLRVKLAEELLDSLRNDAQREVDAAWAKEAESRIDRFDRGESSSEPVSTFLKRLRKRRRSATRYCD